MSNLKNKYEEIEKIRSKIKDKIEELRKNEYVNEYLELNRSDDYFRGEQEKIYADMKREEYSECNHILVCSQISQDYFEGRITRSHSCIKCGLNDAVLQVKRDFLNEDRKIMYDYLLEHTLKGENLNICCHSELATAIYKKIKASHPEVDDKILMSYFMTALDDIRGISVSDERKMSRAKRLSLRSNFDGWDGRAVRYYR